MKYKNFALSFILILIPLIILEIFSSVVILYKENKVGILFSLFNFKKETQINYVINWDKKTNKIVPGKYKIKLKDDIINEYKINSKGFRGNEFTERKKTDYRIISFGGSTTMGLESPDNYTYPDLLEKEFRINKSDVEILNFGLSSKSLNFIRELFFSEAINYDPDLITIYSARNSIMYDSIGTKLKIREIKFQNFEKLNLYLIENIMSYRLMKKIYNKIANLNIDSKKIISPYDKRIEHNIYYFSHQYPETINQIIKYADKNNVKVVLIKQAIYVDPKTQKKLKKKSLNELIDLLKTIKTNQEFQMEYEDIFWILTISILNKHLDNFNNIKNVKIVDPTDALIKDKNNFTDYLHLTVRGNEILAQEIYSKIKNFL